MVSSALKQQSFNVWNYDDEDDDQDVDKQRAAGYILYCFECKICLVGLLIGALVAGIGLAVILTLWLQPSSTLKSKNDQNTNVQPAITISAVSTTTTTSITIITTTTPTPPCTPLSVGSSSTICSITSVSSTAYACYAYEWTSPATGTVELAFQLRNDPSYWFLDDVSVYGGGTDLLTNGDFENATIFPWVVSFPNGVCAGSTGYISGLAPHTGSKSFTDGSNGCADQVAQQFTATIGQKYVVSFWLKSDSTAPIITALVTLS